MPATPSPPGPAFDRRHLLFICNLVDGNSYRSQLGLYFADCPAAVEVAQAAAFSATGVAGVAQVYSQTCALGQPIMRN